MSQHSERQRIALLRILAQSDELPTGDALADRLGCKHRSGARYYLERLTTGGMITVSDTHDDGLVCRTIELTAAAWRAIGQEPPELPKVFTRIWRESTAGLRSAGRCPRSHHAKMVDEDDEQAPIAATLRPWEHDWDGDNFRRAALEDLRRRASRTALTTGGHKPQDLGTDEELSSAA